MFQIPPLAPELLEEALEQPYLFAVSRVLGPCQRVMGLAWPLRSSGLLLTLIAVQWGTVGLQCSWESYTATAQLWGQRGGGRARHLLSSGLSRERKVTVWGDTHDTGPQWLWRPVPALPPPASHLTVPTTSKPAFRGITSSLLQRCRGWVCVGDAHTLAAHHSLSLHP